MQTNNTADAATWYARKLARTEQLLRELMSDLADAVERGEMTSEEANAQYERTAARWMSE